MHFVDDINFIAVRIGRKQNFVFNLPHIVDTRIRSTVDFYYIQTRACRNFRTGGTRPAGGRGRALGTIKHLCKNTRRAGFSAPARPGKQVCVGNLPRFDRLLQGSGDKLLPQQVLKPLRPAPRCCYLIFHTGEYSTNPIKLKQN